MSSHTLRPARVTGRTRTTTLWTRDPVDTNINWQQVGHANAVRAMTAINGKLWAATSDNGLWIRDPVEANINWRQVGHANNVRAMTAIPEGPSAVGSCPGSVESMIPAVRRVGR